MLKEVKIKFYAFSLDDHKGPSHDASYWIS